MFKKGDIAVIAVVLAVAAAGLFFPRGQGETAEVYSGGRLCYLLPLQTNTSVNVEYRGGSNTVTVKDGKVTITDADCPGRDCMSTSARQAGEVIVCVPHRLVVRITGKGGFDAVTG